MLVTCLLALTIAPRAEARVGLAEWRIELPGGLVVCHGDEAPDACGAVCIYDPASSRAYVADVEDFKIYEGVIVGATTRGDFFLLDEPTRVVERFARREELARAIDRRAPAELGGRLEKLAMIHGGYSLVALGLVYAFFAALRRRWPREQPIERSLALYAGASALGPLLAATGFLVIPCLDQDWMGFAALARGEVLAYLLFLHYLPALIGVIAATALANVAALAGAWIAGRRRPPSRWTWLVSYAICHVIVLRLTVGEVILRTSPYWRGGL